MIGFEMESLSTRRPSFLGSNYMVSSGHYLASMAGTKILERGGNAVDAGVATGLCINVLQFDLTNIGGVAPIVLRMARTGEVATISGLGWWPKAATLEELRRRGNDISSGILASVVPSAIDSWITALDRYGTMSFGEVAAPAIELCEQGFPVNKFLAANIARIADKVGRWPSSREVLLSRGRPPKPGERYVQKDLARTFRMLVDAECGAAGRHEGLRAARDLFYKGEIAQRTARFCQEQGGLLTAEDMAEFSVEVEPPIRATYRGYEVYGCGPWCQGPVALQALTILEGYDMGAIPHNSARALHLIVEALDAAFADRHAYLGDPRFVPVPIEGLLSKGYADAWRRRIRTDRAAGEMPAPGDPWAYQSGVRKPAMAAGRPRPRGGAVPPDTSYLCVLDAEGNAFSATPSDGARDTPIVPGLGFIISPRGHQSWLDPDHPSSVAPGKRPRLSPNPGLVVKDGETFMVYGSPGLDAQPQAMVQLLVNIIDHGMEAQEAIEHPRVVSYNFPSTSHPHPYSPGQLSVEGRIPETVRAELADLGHRVETWPEWTPKAGALCAVVRNSAERTLAGGADPRRLAYAVGW